MNQNERNTIIEWLYVTGTRHSFWNKYDDETLDGLYQRTIEEHQLLC